jgi:methylenetetrahydrofolate--tRNA-(uracil-5-)-methyltransferase
MVQYALSMKKADVIIVGGGLAGSEAAWQVAQRGLHVQLYEMRPFTRTPAHQTAGLAELVCSNSLGSDQPDRASGLIKNELRSLGSLLLRCAKMSALPAGTALAVDRDSFSQMVTQSLYNHPNIELIIKEITEIPTGVTIIASGPLTSENFSRAIINLTGEKQMFFYDAIAPIVTLESINVEVAFRASRYGDKNTPDGDYLNCPFNKTQYDVFVEALISAQRIPLRDFETDILLGVDAGSGNFFEGCLPVEIIARRSPKALSFGTMRPTGLVDPRTERRPYAVIQLRQDNILGSLYNMVGFQTNLTYPEQKRIFQTIPGLENAEFIRYGQMHRNTFIASPRLLLPSLQYKGRPNLLFAGQITGVEGYVGNIATGLLAGINAANIACGSDPLVLPDTTMLGALCAYISNGKTERFQPMKANFGLLPALPEKRRMNKRERALVLSERARLDLATYITENKGKLRLCENG